MLTDDFDNDKNLLLEVRVQAASLSSILSFLSFSSNKMDFVFFFSRKAFAMKRRF
jgi:hypothetical protein